MLYRKGVVMKNIIYLVRHAQSDNSVKDEATRPLTEKGLRDRHLACGWLADKNISAIYSSPYFRAADTVRPLAESLGLEIETMDCFKERQRGDASGIEDLVKGQWDDPDFAAPGGESRRQVGERFARGISDIMKKHKGESLVIASHGMAISSVQSYYDPSFGYGDFLKVQDVMPRVVRLSFDEGGLLDMEEIILQ